jgi:hypothetical protein
MHLLSTLSRERELADAMPRFRNLETGARASQSPLESSVGDFSLTYSPFSLLPGGLDQ